MAESVEQIVASFKLDLSDLRAQLEGVKTDLRSIQTTATTSATSAGASFDAAGASIKQAMSSKVIDAAVASVNDLEDSLAGVESKAASVKAQIRQNTAELAKMQLAGKEGTKAFEELRASTAKLVLGLRQVKEGINSSSQQFMHLKAGAEALRTVAAGYEAMVGIQSLFGEKNEDVEKSLRKIMGVMALVNGLTEISNALKSESNLMTDLAILKENILTKSKWLQVDATMAEKAAETGYIGIAIAGATAIAALIYKVITAQEEHAKQQREFTEELERQNIALEHQKELQGILGVSKNQTEIQLEQNKIFAAENAIAEIVRTRNNTILKLNNDLTIEQQEAVDKQSNIITEAQGKISNLTVAGNQELIKLTEEQQKRLAELYKDGVSKDLALYILDRENQKKELTKKLTEFDTNLAEQQKQALLAGVKMADIQAMGAKERSQKAAIIAAFEAQTKKGYLERTVKGEIDALEEMKSIISINGGDVLGIEQKILEKRKELHQKGSSDYRTILNDQRILQLETLKAQLQVEITAFEQQKSEMEVFGEDTYTLQQKIYDKQIEQAKGNAIKIKDIQGQKRILELNEQKKHLEMLASNAEQEALDIESKHKIEASNTYDPVRIAEMNKRNNEETANAKINQLRTQQALTKDVQKQADLENEITRLENEQANQAQLDDKAIREAKLKQLIDTVKVYTQTSGELISGIFKNVGDREEQLLQDKFRRMSNLLTEWHSREVNMVGRTAKQKEMIETQYAEKQRKLQQQQAIEEAKIKREQAMVDKATKLSNVIMQTAENVTKYTGGLPATAPLLAEAVITGAVQAALIASQPLPAIPKFATGIVKIDGPGTETSDSIPALLSKNESVINAAATRKHEDALIAINTGNYERFVLEKYLKPALKMAGPTIINSESYDDFMLRNEVKGTNKRLDKLIKGVVETKGQNGRFYA